MTFAVFSCRNLLQTSAVARVVPAGAQGTESRLPKLGSKLQLPDVKLLNGKVWTPKNRPPARLWCTSGRTGALFVHCSRRLLKPFGGRKKPMICRCWRYRLTSKKAPPLPL